MSKLAGAVLSSVSAPTQELICRQALLSAPLLRSALETLFVNRFGHQKHFEQLRFLFFVAPLVRRLVMDSANLNETVGSTDITFAEVRSWLDWLDAMDPMCARMIELRYFAGVSVKETAQLLDLPADAVVRELRFARAWLGIKLRADEPETADELG